MTRRARGGTASEPTRIGHATSRRQRWGVRLGALGGCLLLALSVTGWWLSSRVLDGDGFADVVAISSQRQPVRDYVADQATLRLASTSSFVSVARPAVTDALSAAIATQPVKEAVHDAAKRAHDQVFQASTARRVDVNAAQASETVRAALQTINPAMAKKLPANVLDASATVSQSSEVDLLFRISPWVEILWLPVGALGVGLLTLVLVRARERVRALRVIGITMAVVGSLLVGFGAATPAFAAVAATNDPGRGEAVGEFISVLLGRLVGGGGALVLVGVLLCLAPGRDGGDLVGRWRRLQRWVHDRRDSRRWRLVLAAVLVVLAVGLLTSSSEVLSTFRDLGAVLILYVAIVLALRATGMLVVDPATPRFRKRQAATVAVAMVAAFSLTAGTAVALVAATTPENTANANTDGCNGYIELCEQRLNQVVWPASHNAMSSTAYDFFTAEHTLTITDQLNAGVRFFMLDAYYGYDEDGLVRTNLAGGVDREQLRQEKGDAAVRELDRLGALTGAADTSGKRQDVYFCHDFCELGAVKAVDALSEVRAFLDRNLTDVVILDFEDYVKPADLRRVLADAGLLDQVWQPKRSDLVDGAPKQMPVLGAMVTAGHEGVTTRRVVVMTEKHKPEYPWQLSTYQVSEETPFDFAKVRDFSCRPNRGGTGKPFFIVNHWLRGGGPPDPAAARTVNSEKTLTDRMRRCAAERKRLPNALAVDFTAIGSLGKTVNKLNAAVAELTGTREFFDRWLDHSALTPAERRALVGNHRLPRVSAEDARRLLGPAAPTLHVPTGLAQLEEEFDREDREAATRRAERAADSTSTTTSTVP